jgi:hypothetical protein
MYIANAAVAELHRRQHWIIMYLHVKLQYKQTKHKHKQSAEHKLTFFSMLTFACRIFNWSSDWLSDFFVRKIRTSKPRQTSVRANGPKDHLRRMNLSPRTKNRLAPREKIEFPIFRRKTARHKTATLNLFWSVPVHLHSAIIPLYVGTYMHVFGRQRKREREDKKTCSETKQAIFFTRKLWLLLLSPACRILAVFGKCIRGFFHELFIARQFLFGPRVYTTVRNISFELFYHMSYSSYSVFVWRVGFRSR